LYWSGPHTDHQKFFLKLHIIIIHQTSLCSEKAISQRTTNTIQLKKNKLFFPDSKKKKHVIQPHNTIETIVFIRNTAAQITKALNNVNKNKFTTRKLIVWSFSSSDSDFNQTIVIMLGQHILKIKMKPCSQVPKFDTY
jgi:hypothetical protein